MMRHIALLVSLAVFLAGCGQEQAAREERAVHAKGDSLREADAFLSEEAAPQGVPFDAYKYETRAGRLMALLVGADTARADKVLRQAVKTLEAQEALAGHPFSFNSVEAELLKTAAEKCHSLDGLRYSVERLSTAKQHQLSLFDDLARTFSPVLSQAMEVKQAETRAVRGTPVARVVPLAEALMKLNRKFGGALVPGMEECLAALTCESGGVQLSDVERKALVAMIAKAPKSRFLEAARFCVEAAAAAAKESIDTPLPPSPECIGFYRQVLEDESLAPMWRASVYWQAYHSRRLTRSRVATVFPDPEAADNELAPARALMVKAAGLAASSATRIERRDISLLLDELNTAPVTLEWKAAAAPLVDTWKTATRSRLSRERQFSPNDRIDEYERNQALAVLESCLKLGDRASAEWLLAETAFQLGRWPETYGVLAESPWADLVSQTLAKNAKDIEIVAWYHSGGMSPRILMTAAQRQAADQMIRAIALPDVAYLAEALYAAMPVIGPVEEGRYGLGPHPTRIHQKRLIDLAEEFPKLKFEDAGLREKALELLLARPTWWRLKDELFAWGAKQKPANVCQAEMRDLRGGRLMEQYAACLVLLVNDGKPEPAMRALEVIRAELRIPNHEAPHRVINDIRLSLWALLTVQPDSFYRAMPFPLAREAGDYIEFARAVCLSEDRCNDSNHDLGEAVMALYAAAGRAGEMARFSEEFAAKTGQRDPQNAALGSREPLRIDLSVFERLLQSVPPEKHVETVGRLYACLEKGGINARARFEDPARGKAKGQPVPLLAAAIDKWWAGQIESLRKQVAENPTDNNALGNLIAACEATGDFRSAIELFRRWHGTTEDAGRWGRFLYNQEHAEEIGDALVEYAGKWPEKRWVYLHDASEAYLRANRNGKAVAAVLDAFAADPADPNVQSKALQVLMKCGEYKCAVAVGEKSLLLKPESPRSSPDTTREQWLGRAYTELGRVDEAIAMYRRALAAANPGSDLFLGLLRSASDLLVKQGKFGEAVRMCQDGLRSTKDPERRLWIQGMIIDAFTAAKQQDKVIEAAGEGLRMCQSLPDSVTSSYVTKWATARGRACLFLKQYDEAMKMAAMAQAGDLTWQIQEALLTETGLEVPAGASAPSGG